MNVKALVIVAVALVALGGLVALSWDQDSDMPTEGDDNTYFEVTQCDYTGSHIYHITILFSKDPIQFQLYYDGVPLSNLKGYQGPFEVRPDLTFYIPTVIYEDGLTPEKLTEKLEIRSPYCDPVPSDLV